MKRICILLLAAVILLSACGRQTSMTDVEQEPSWQEQYDLGVRYLSEGNYEEAIIAFTAAIEVDPKQAPAYVGRGDAYSGTALQATGSASDLPKEAITSYESAVADYLTAIDLDNQKAEVYLKAAEAYITLGDTDAAMEILSDGYEATGDESLHERMTALMDIEGQSESVTVRGRILFNPDEYKDLWMPYIDQYQSDNNNQFCSIDSYGIRFEDPVQVTIGGETISIQEACFCYDQTLIDTETQLHNHETDTNGPLIGPILELQGYFYRNDQMKEFEGPIYREEDGMTRTYYNYRPNGDFNFYMTTYEIM